jgi:hypothetical protein
MHTVDLLGEAVALAERLGYRMRQEWLGGNGGGGCELKGRKWLFLDLALGPADQLDQVLDTLRREPQAMSLTMPSSLRERLLEEHGAKGVKRTA